MFVSELWPSKQRVSKHPTSSDLPRRRSYFQGPHGSDKRTGGLHLEIYVERMKREYSVDCTAGKARVNFRE
ncbi:hypothetical protein JOM56_004762 [Amanita muscaria]